MTVAYRIARHSIVSRSATNARSSGLNLPT
jgi:hypothetical protein